jgi:DNA-binding PadR family transcriptional regulator
MKNQKTKFVILGLLSIKPQSGYDMKKLIDKSIRHFWSESNGQLYPSLSQLVKDNYICLSVKERAREKARQEYSITESGRSLLRTWLSERVEQKNSHRDELLLKLFFGASCDVQLSIEQLKEREVKIQETLAQFHELEKHLEKTSNSPHHVFWSLTLKNGLLHAQTEIAWCREAIKMLEKDMSC